MAEEKKVALEREYIIPLRRKWILLPRYRRAGRAAKTIKEFIAKHMKVSERDVEKVKLDNYLNNEIWFRGRRNPPAKIKVKAIKEGDIVKVGFVEIPEHIRFLKAKHEKVHKKMEVKEEKKEEFPEPSEEEKKEDAEKKKDEAEKEKAVEETGIKEAKKEKLAEKHAPKAKKTEIHRTSMNRH